MGTSISIVRGLLKDILGHAYNFGFFVVTRITTLEVKNKTFYSRLNAYYRTL